MTAAIGENAGEIAELRKRLSDLEGQAGPRPPVLVVSREAAE